MMAVRAYVRLDPDFPDHKAQYPDGALSALVFCFCFAAQQPKPGVFRNRRLLTVLLDKRARWIAYLIEHRDLIEHPDGRLYVEGWEEWQEGNHPVADRMRLIKMRRGETLPERSPGAQRTANWRLRSQVFERDAFTCRYCGNADYERDWLVLEHVAPGGPTTLENLVTACRPCNKIKGGRTPEQAGMVLRPVTGHSIAPGDASQEISRDVSRLSEHVARAPRESASASALANGVSVAPARDSATVQRTNGTTTKKPPLDEERIATYQAELDNPGTPDWKRDAIVAQLGFLGVHPDSERSHQ